MRLSVKTRYGLAAVVAMAQDGGAQVTLARLSERLDISKIYLEQVFSLLKRGGVVCATKGAQGGYHLAKPPGELTPLDVVSAIETALFEPTEATVEGTAAPIESALRELCFDPLDAGIRAALSEATMAELAAKAGEDPQAGGFMFYL